MKRLLILYTLAVAFILSVTVNSEKTKKEELPKHDYVGVKKCKICHKKDGVYESWQITPHAAAWDSLSAEDQKNKELLPYYTTGTTAKGELLTGIQCEACHGPGSDYKKKSIMKDREKSIANGLLIPTEETCKRCHNKDAPAALAATAKNWKYEEMKDRGIHALKVEEEVSK